MADQVAQHFLGDFSSTDALFVEPVARVYGEPMAQLPLDLYIPPDALAVMLDAFEGPLDLLLELARQHKVDLSQISILDLADQYIAYVDRARAMRLELA